ncbi:MULTISPECIES: DEAD/DEAH box helicase family protein [Citrobacter freundii complex]|uniref:DEAD/DEAH box helicase family protein n=1 Tax=Citrobacter freundii complex TaxID=1344959 RepID=UPI000F68F825|nr:MULTISPECIES: DEAD/DEAH box helicase family protein [Citrobacter freundii complex]EKW0743132.1 DEAD/DEAH box helicase family protein [Citrobacter freundii]KAA0548235.1 type III restriction endonuclease subunit R [Citrobacter braakii]MBJ9038516.1 DEAD/DEAH box helicase family protein [Citrobacter freundii]MDT7130900.1 DEAD/DEAH box helicase family protein [Citrobacter braakii]QMN73980.1 DEAD/DEAH box helicase family protein [Citrobacter freundii]
MASPKTAAKTKQKKRSFHQELVLNRWVMRFFKGNELAALKLRLGDDQHEGIDDDGQTLFFHELTRNLFEVDWISEADLRRYDLHIVEHWQSITKYRNQLEGHVLNMKYFQYLSLLFTEIYLDWYFTKPQALLDGLNEELATYSKEQGAETFQPYIASDLNKIAFWNATGSGKTLLLHVNIKQYLHYFQAGNSSLYPDKIILLTPNEGLSKQHLEELELSGFSFSRFFDKNRTNTFKGTIEIIDINKLGDSMGDKTVAVEAFEGNNLVLVDEGHRGTGTAAGAWMQRRDALVRGGFAFEYSATFGQAVAKGNTVAKTEEELLKKKAKTLFDTTVLKKLDDVQLAQLALTQAEQRQARVTATRENYAKCILFDYSYKYFYDDGYGKESLILNMNGEAYEQADNAQKYFTACLLSFYQQIWLWQTHQGKLNDFNIEKPLWVFVGNTVSGEDSDILEVVQFLSFFLNDERTIKAWLKELVDDKAQLLDVKGNNIFQGRFNPLMGFSDNIDGLYSDILHKMFNANARQRLKLVNIKNSKGELALRVGDAEPFGLISIGDDSGFYKTAEELDSFDSEADDFGGALFGTLNNKDSKLNVLIGSRKFTEGWSSWRVSTMGLLNMGQGEGSQIIQLFGRGVRLKGKDFSLKRTAPNQRPKGLYLDKLETLNIFGVRASYMAAFKDYLKEEGITPSDEIIELDFPTQPNLPTKKLKTLALKDGYKDNQKLGFKRTHYPWLYVIPAEFDGKIKTPHIALDLYPRLEAISTTEGSAVLQLNVRHEGKLNQAHFALFDFDRIYLALQAFKQQRNWSNLRLDKQRLIDFCLGEHSWYTLYMPKPEFEAKSFADIKRLEDILIRLLCDYTERFYKALKTGYEGQFYEVIPMHDEHGSMLKLYHFEINDSDDGHEYLKKLEVLKALVAKGDLGEASKWNAPHMVAISFDRHLFYPLLSLEDKDAVPLKMRPLAFDAPSEIQFIEDLQAFYGSSVGREAIGTRSLYLLRNADSKNKGIGFATAGNFYPDFLLWLVDDASGEQWLSFVDPKGLKHMDLNHPKLGLYTEIKKIEADLTKQAAAGEPALTLNAFVLSPTKYADLLNVGDKVKKQELEDKHMLFMEDGGNSYLKKMFDRIN